MQLYIGASDRNYIQIQLYSKLHLDYIQLISDQSRTLSLFRPRQGLYEAIQNLIAYSSIQSEVHVFRNKTTVWEEVPSQFLQ